MKSSEEKLIISGSFARVDPLAVRVAAALGAGLVAFLSWKHADFTEDGMVLGYISIGSLTVLVAMLWSKCQYVDFANKAFVTLKHFAGIEVGRSMIPLSKFSAVVIRHVCHDGGEMKDSYTGSVGLKPEHGNAVTWVKEFATNQDDIPQEAYEFARALAERTGLPLRLPGPAMEGAVQPG